MADEKVFWRALNDGKSEEESGCYMELDPMFYADKIVFSYGDNEVEAGDLSNAFVDNDLTDVIEEALPDEVTKWVSTYVTDDWVRRHGDDLSVELHFDILTLPDEVSAWQDICDSSSVYGETYEGVVKGVDEETMKSLREELGVDSGAEIKISYDWSADAHYEVFDSEDDSEPIDEGYLED